MSQIQFDLESPMPMPTSDGVTLIRQKGRYNPVKQNRLKNNLLAGVAFLELANAGDFAANVWNETPVPRFAVALMAVGGTFAIVTSYFAFKDAELSWHNILLLREERLYLQIEKAEHVRDTQIALDGQLDVNFREMGTELIHRIGLDIAMGFGLIMVGVGTLMAIGAADPQVYKASNLMSGYIGNSPVAFYSVFNVVWCAYVWRRANRHGAAGAKKLKEDIVERLLKRRIRAVKAHVAIIGVTSIVAGAASIITATKWWGYPILVPCIISSIFSNYIWRYRIGYNRPLARQMPRGGKDYLIEELKFVNYAQQVLKETPSQSLFWLVSDTESIASILEFMVKNDLFEDFCIRLLEEVSLSTMLFGTSNEELTIDSQDLLIADKLVISRFLQIAQTCVTETGLMHFQDRERYLLETLGCCLCTSGIEGTFEK